MNLFTKHKKTYRNQKETNGYQRRRRRDKKINRKGQNENKCYKIR